MVRLAGGAARAGRLPVAAAIARPASPPRTLIVLTAVCTVLALGASASCMPFSSFSLAFACRWNLALSA